MDELLWHIMFLLTIRTSCVCFQTSACCQKWPSRWTPLGTGGSGDSEMASSSLQQKPHHCCPQRRRDRAAAWRSSGLYSPTTACSTETGPRSPGDTPAIGSARPNIPSSPSCPRISWSSFTGRQALGQTTPTLTKYLTPIQLRDAALWATFPLISKDTYFEKTSHLFIHSFIQYQILLCVIHVMGARDTWGKKRDFIERDRH